MEKERKRAAEMGYPSLIQPDKQSTDKDYDAALHFCVDNLEKVAFVAGTHNENSCRVLADLLNEKKVLHNHPHVYFSQLLGMSDNLSFNLADAGYNVAKYVPYGPVKSVLLICLEERRKILLLPADEQGVNLILKEKRRRVI